MSASAAARRPPHGGFHRLSTGRRARAAYGDFVTRTRTILAAAAALALATPPAPAAAQTVVERPISLEETLATARDGALGLATAEGEAAIAAARARQAGAFRWPRADVGLGVTRSTDPVFAFGTRLRQGIFTEADLALDALNDPAAISDWTPSLDVAWGALDAGRWAGWTAARSAAEAAGWRAVRAREATGLRARILYWGAVAASARREAAEASEEAARATSELFRRRQERGLLTEADRLQAEAERAAARATVVDAARAEREARRDLGVFLGLPPDTIPVPTDTLAPPPPAAGEPFDPAARADVRAMGAAAAARAAERRGAALAFLPSVRAFGRWAGHGDGPGPDDEDWTVGVGLTWTAFAGFSRFAERDAAARAERIARLAFERARIEAAAEVDLADGAVAAAAEAADAALAARAAAETAADLMRRRFEEGLAGATDVLQAEARRASARGRAVDALAAWRVAAARAVFVRSESRTEESP